MSYLKSTDFFWPNLSVGTQLTATSSSSLKLNKFSTSTLRCQENSSNDSNNTNTNASNSTNSESSNNNNLSTNKNLFYVEHVKDKNYVIFRLNRAPVNSLNLDFLTELNIQLEKFDQSKDINGVVLTSHIPNIFSAGLDIMEMYKIKTDRGRQFWSTLQDFWLKLYGSNKIYIAAINVFDS